ncbi:preprotein translocase subunit YajC [Acidiferrobacter sp.]|uniref:preprotein translocase subunit YajC n=1 Tax=Acidiferrobacter sp. TaxID=1872107 RepID=UPI00261D2D65|nr:preprotein translocase subunit YajC [Acidiferrobacter sp.]
MIHIISNAWAAAPAAPPSEAAGLFQFLPLILIVVLMYFLIMRPQNKRAREQRAMLAALTPGDEVVVAGGMLGRLTEVNPQYSKVEVAPGVVVQIQTSSVQLVLPKDTIGKDTIGKKR